MKSGIRLILIIAACATIGATPPSDKGDDVVTGGDLAFMNEAAPGGLAEVELGRLAAEQAVSSKVKRFAEQMVADHGKVGAQLEELAQQKQVKLPKSLLPKAIQAKEKLSQLHGDAFDHMYIEMMVQMHEKDVAAFTAVAKNATDADVKAFTTAILPTLQHHLEMARDIAQEMKLGKAE